MNTLNRPLVSFTKPSASGVTCTVTFNAHAPKDRTSWPIGAGVALRHSPGGKKGSLLSWDEIVHSLGWALERSPEMRACIREMLEAIEAGPVSP